MATIINKINGLSILSGPGGSNTQIQFNSGSTLTGTGSFVFNHRSQSLQVGFNSIASGPFSAVIAGDNSQAKGPYDLAHGTSVVAWSDSGSPGFQESAHAEGGYTLATNNYSHAEGHFATASGEASHAEGYYTRASGSRAHSEGHFTLSSGVSAHAEGYFSTASGDYSHAEGGYDQGVQSYKGGVASGKGSHAEGLTTLASGPGSHAEGEFTLSTGRASHVEGYLTTASSGADYGHAEGIGTIAVSPYQHVQGTYNLAVSGAGAFIHGNGTSTTRKNLIYASGSQFQVTGSLLASGSTTLTGPVTVNTTGGLFEVTTDNGGYGQGYAFVDPAAWGIASPAGEVGVNGSTKVLYIGNGYQGITLDPNNSVGSYFAAASATASIKIFSPIVRFTGISSAPSSSVQITGSLNVSGSNNQIRFVGPTTITGSLNVSGSSAQLTSPTTVNGSLTITGSLKTQGAQIRKYREITLTNSDITEFPTQAVALDDDIILIVDDTTSLGATTDATLDVSSFLATAPAGQCVEIVKVKDGTGTGIVIKATSMAGAGLMLNGVSVSNGNDEICLAAGDNVILMSRGTAQTGSIWGVGY